ECDHSAEDEVREESADERADDAEDDGPDPAHRIRTRHEESRDSSGDQADDDERENRTEIHIRLLSCTPSGLQSACPYAPEQRSARIDWCSRPGRLVVQGASLSRKRSGVRIPSGLPDALYSNFPALRRDRNGSAYSTFATCRPLT